MQNITDKATLKVVATMLISKISKTIDDDVSWAVVSLNHDEDDNAKKFLKAAKDSICTIEKIIDALLIVEREEGENAKIINDLTGGKVKAFFESLKKEDSQKIQKPFA